MFDRLKNAVFSRTVNWAHGWLPPSSLEVKSPQPQLPAEFYLTIRMVSMRLTLRRRGIKRVYGLMDARVSLPRSDGSLAEFSTVATPAELRNVRPKDVDRVIVRHHRILGPVAYVGGDLDLQVGLHCVRGADLSAPYIELLSAVSAQAGVNVVAAALPFVGPLRRSLDLLLGADGPSALEVGLIESLNPPRLGHLCVVAGPRERVDVEQMRLSDQGLLTTADGKALEEFSWMVFEFEASTERLDWHQIPSLSAAYNDVRAVIARGGTAQELKDAVTVFSRLAKTSPDLLADDASRLCGLVENAVTQASPPTLTATAEPSVLPPLAELGLYPG